MRHAGSFVLGLTLVFWAAPSRAQSIFDAVETGTPGQVQALVAKDTSLVNVRDAAGETPLHHAAIGGSVPMIECLLSLGAAIDAANTENLTPLLEAVRSGRDAAANALIEKGARIDGVLHWAARFNRTAVIERLIARGADVEARDPQGFTPLTAAARMGGPFEAIELLVRKGANVNLPDSLGNTPLDNAIIYGGTDNRIIDLLLARSAAVNTEPPALASTLSTAARRGHVRLFDYYLARGGEALLATESNRRTVMRSATIGGSLEMVKALRARGIPLDLTSNRNGATPVHSLASNPKALDMIELLVRNGADVNDRTNDGRSAYNIADAAGNREVASLLLKLGASPEPQKFPPLTGPYLGQTPPGDELTAFAPGIVYLDHGTISVSPDGQELYWPTGTAIMMTRVQDGRWTRPVFAPFSGPSDIPFHDDVPFVTPDNKRLFFTSKRAVAAGAPQKENIWFVERTPTGWSEPRSIGPAVNAMSLHWQVSVSNAGTLYFGGRSEKDGYGSADLYCSRLVNGEYTAPVNLGPAINTKDGESQPFIAPDESFILFFRAPGQVPSAYVSFRDRDGRWLPAVKFDLPWAGAGLIVSPDGKYLFAGGQWKSAGFLDELRRRDERGDGARGRSVPGAGERPDDDCVRARIGMRATRVEPTTALRGE
jgi:ankyrin repeat protein